MSKKTLAISLLSSQVDYRKWTKNLEHLNSQGFGTKFFFNADESVSPITTSVNSKTRAQTLISLIKNPEIDIIWAGRGGYGASDLLPQIPWSQIEKFPQKILVGFSDFSAILSAFYTKLNWPGIHGPMPLSDLFTPHSKAHAVLTNLLKKPQYSYPLKLNPINSSEHYPLISGTLFGGCLSVLTNLIGTPFLPKSLKNHVLFFEDISESPPKVFRALNQWQQSGMFKSVKAIILGRFTEMKRDLSMDEQKSLEKKFRQECAHRIQGIPLFYSSQIGHIKNQYPLVIGSKVQIKNSLLTVSSTLGKP